MNKLVLAVDLGGTNLRVSAVDADGKIHCHAKCATPRSSGPGRLVDALVTLANECRIAVGGNAVIEAIGIAAPAVLNAAEGRIVRAPNLPELDGFLLSAEIFSRLALPVVLENDATAAAIGEHRLGASRDTGTSILVTLGTGVGGGIIINGVPLRGPDGTAGEVGHICVEPLGLPCGCGSFGCLEQYASATAVVRMAAEMAALQNTSTALSVPGLTSLDVYEAGKQGNALAIAVFARMGYYLGIVLAGLVDVLNPEMIVLGGGLSSAWDLFIDHTRDQIFRRAFREPAERVKLVRAELGDDAGSIGAAYLAFSSK